MKKKMLVMGECNMKLIKKDSEAEARKVTTMMMELSMEQRQVEICCTTRFRGQIWKLIGQHCLTLLHTA